MTSLIRVSDADIKFFYHSCISWYTFIFLPRIKSLYIYLLIWVRLSCSNSSSRFESLGIAQNISFSAPPHNDDSTYKLTSICPSYPRVQRRDCLDWFIIISRPVLVHGLITWLTVLRIGHGQSKLCIRHRVSWRCISFWMPSTMVCIQTFAVTSSSHP